MANVVNLKDVRIILEAGQTADQIRADMQDALDRLLCADVSKFDGRMLRKARDHILQFRWMLAAGSPEGRKLIEAQVRTLNRALSEDEALEALAPELAKVSVHFR